jgi:hypothetical protein
MAVPVDRTSPLERLTYRLSHRSASSARKELSEGQALFPDRNFGAFVYSVLNMSFCLGDRIRIDQRFQIDTIVESVADFQFS